jgi:chorismate mutase
MVNRPGEAYVIERRREFLTPGGEFTCEELTMYCRGVRGATTVEADTRDEILSSTRQLLALMIRLNGIDPHDVGSAIFSTTVDLNAEFPALAARQLGWLEVPLLCTHELDVPGSLRRCIRVLINWNTDKLQHDITHVYIKDAVKLRPDLCNLPPVDMAELEAWIAEQVAHYKK